MKVLITFVNVTRSMNHGLLIDDTACHAIRLSMVVLDSYGEAIMCDFLSEGLGQVSFVWKRVLCDAGDTMMI